MKNIPSTAKQRSMIGFLVGKLKLDAETKEELIWSYTDGISTSIKSLNFTQAKDVITALTKGRVELKTPAEKMRRKILSMAHELYWELADGKIDMARVNRWCTQFGYLHKPLNDYTADELPALVTAFENMYLKHLKGT